MPDLFAALFAGALAVFAQPAPPATLPPRDESRVRVATWNVENWHENFEAFRRKGERPSDPAAQKALQQEGFQNDEDNWEVAQVLRDPAFNPDILVIQEGPLQAELEQFNTQWMGGAYETVHVFAGNGTLEDEGRAQTVAILARPGFKVVEVREDYHKMPDEGDLNPRSDFLFARGPAFVLIEAPGGVRFWVGTTHQKSKSGNDAAVTRWRNAEAAATHQIMRGLRKAGPQQVILMGDMNDELHVQPYEVEGGGDVMATLAGPPENGFLLATRELADSGQLSFMGYWRDTYRSLIDHVVISEETAPLVQQVAVYDSPLARVASDHLPVYVDLKPEN